MEHRLSKPSCKPGRRRSIRWKRCILWALLADGLCIALALGGIWIYTGSYGLNVLWRNGPSHWIHVTADSPRLSPSIRLALAEAPEAAAAPFAWRRIDDGFEVAEMPVVAGHAEVDRIMLARIDPARFRFVVRNAAAGDKDLDGWMAELGAALVINGSYFSRRGRPVTPFVSAGANLGPERYDARAGAFVASAEFVGLRDLAKEDWQAAFSGAQDAMVSYPLLVAADGSSRVAVKSRWLATRSFIGQDKAGRIILGTTTDAFFSLDRLAAFLRQSPLGLTMALNLDGGPVACQGISLKGFERRVYGKWEMQVQGDDVDLLRLPYGHAVMPIVLAVLPK
jgi:hypothetical protein